MFHESIRWVDERMVLVLWCAFYLGAHAGLSVLKKSVLNIFPNPLVLQGVGELCTTAYAVARVWRKGGKLGDKLGGWSSQDVVLLACIAAFDKCSGTVALTHITLGSKEIIRGSKPAAVVLLDVFLCGQRHSLMVIGLVFLAAGGTLLGSYSGEGSGDPNAEDWYAALMGLSTAASASSVVLTTSMLSKGMNKEAILLTTPLASLAILGVFKIVGLDGGMKASNSDLTTPIAASVFLSGVASTAYAVLRLSVYERLGAIGVATLGPCKVVLGVVMSAIFFEVVPTLRVMVGAMISSIAIAKLSQHMKSADDEEKETKDTEMEAESEA